MSRVVGMKSRASPRLGTSSLQQEVTTHEHHGIPHSICCMAMDAEDKITFLFTESALYTVTASGTTALLCSDEHQSGFSDGARCQVRFSGPAGMLLDKPKKLMCVADTGNHVVRIVQLMSGYVHSVAGLGEISGMTDGTGDAARFHYPTGLVMCRNGSLIVSDKNNHALRIVELQGHPGNQYGPFMGNPRPAVVTTLCGGTPGDLDGPGDQARFNGPMGLAVDSKGNMIVADFHNSSIRYEVMASDGSRSCVVKTIVGYNSSKSLDDSRWHVDGDRRVARVNHPASVCVDNHDNIIVADTNNNVLRVCRPFCGRVVTIAGGPQGAGVTADGRPPPRQKPVDGRGASVRFNRPFQVMLDREGIVHVLEQFNLGAIRRLPLGVQCCEDD